MVRNENFVNEMVGIILYMKFLYVAPHPQNTPPLGSTRRQHRPEQSPLV